MVLAARNFDTLGGLYQEVAARGGRVAAGVVQSKTGITPNQILGAVKNPQRVIHEITGKIGDPTAALKPSGAWGLLSEFLIANLYVLTPAGDGSGTYTRDFAEGDVSSPITDANFDATLNWQSPFENAGAESKAPNLMAMIQTGQIGTALSALGATGLADAFGMGNQVDSLQKQAQDGAKSIEGRTGITKINSRQAFSGMPPVKLTMTMHFRALSDAKSEVVEPFQRLLRWAFPQELAADGYLTGIVKGASTSKADALKALFPSKAPRIIGMRYGNMRYEPMVIEGISHPFDGSLTSEGHPAYRAVQLALSTLTALDQNDVRKLFIR